MAPDPRRLAKAAELLTVAESDLERGFFASAISRAYYASFHAAIAYVSASFPDDEKRDRWSHGYVRTRFAWATRDNQTGLHARHLRRLYQSRIAVDYRLQAASESDARDAVEWTTSLVAFCLSEIAWITQSDEG